MRFTFAIILAVAAASASSISARTIGDSDTDGCPPECWVDGICLSCPSDVCNYRFCRKQESIGPLDPFTLPGAHDPAPEFSLFVPVEETPSKVLSVTLVPPVFRPPPAALLFSKQNKHSCTGTGLPPRSPTFQTATLAVLKQNDVRALELRPDSPQFHGRFQEHPSRVVLSCAWSTGPGLENIQGFGANVGNFDFSQRECRTTSRKLGSQQQHHGSPFVDDHGPDAYCIFHRSWLAGHHNHTVLTLVLMPKEPLVQPVALSVPSFVRDNPDSDVYADPAFKDAFGCMPNRCSDKALALFMSLKGFHENLSKNTVESIRAAFKSSGSKRMAAHFVESGVLTRQDSAGREIQPTQRKFTT
ncbi:hypothetical protein EV424DRAFT_1543061 [Suillus variegatus]|nr:hypothetical protein EV424DRAFT_1543061 [Suillus variegatus]